MIALDASALRVILLNEPEAPWFARMMAENDCLVAATTRLEAVWMVRQSGKPRLVDALEAVFSWRNVETVAISSAHLAFAELCAAQIDDAATVPSLSMIASRLPAETISSGSRLMERLRPMGPDVSAHISLEAPQAGHQHLKQLNLGPCLSYAVARVAVVPLLFKDEALSRTDIEPAWRL